jgi:hypothetical protein
MKKYFVVALVAMMAVTASAQKHEYYNTKHEIGVTIGAGAVTEIFSGLADFANVAVEAAVSSVATFGLVSSNYTYGDESYLPNITAEYYYHVSPGIAVGGFVGFNGMNRDMIYQWRDNVSGTTHEEKAGTAKRLNISVIPAVKFDWLRTKYFGMYSKLGVGVSFMHESQEGDTNGDKVKKADYSDTTVIPNLQASFVGMEFGSENFRGFAELGIGEQGILLGGLKYKF